MLIKKNGTKKKTPGTKEIEKPPAEAKTQASMIEGLMEDLTQWDA